MAPRRGSRQREAILKVLRETNTHPTADWIYDRVRKIIPNISLGTVYRNLNFLVSQGLVREVIVQGSSSAKYDANIEPHHHFICLNCNSIYDLPNDEISLDVSQLEKKRKFKISYVNLDIYGTCAKCLGYER